MTEQAAPFLTIVTRHLYTRKKMRKRNRRSVKAQTSQDLQHLIIKDKKGRGYRWADKNLSKIAHLIEGEYVYILDDDDYLIYPKFVKKLKSKIEKHGYPDIVFVKARWIPFKGHILPSKSWGKKPVCGDIGSPCFIVRRKLWIRYISRFGQPAHGDYYFIKKVFKKARSVYWWDKLVAEVSQIGHHKDRH